LREAWESGGLYKPLEKVEEGRRMICPGGVYSKWKELVLSIPPSKVAPAIRQLPVRVRQPLLKRLQTHKRAKSLEVYNFISRSWDKVFSELPEEYKRGYCFNDAYVGLCPNPFSLDLYRGGWFCYGCIYCFALRCEESLLSSFYDNYVTGMVSPYKTFREDWERYEKSDTPIGRAIRRRLVLHVGNNIESFVPQIEQKYGVGKEFLQFMKDIQYPVILNTKSDIWDRPDFFNLLGEMENVMVQMTIITHDDNIGKRLEPLAPTVSRRLEVLKTLNESGIKAVIRAEPLIMNISPTTEQEIREFGNKVLDAKVPYLNVGDYNLSVKGPDLEAVFASQGLVFDNALNCEGFLRYWYPEYVIFILQEMGLKVGSFNPTSYPLMDAEDCCGYTLQGDTPKCGFDRMNVVEVTREIIRRGSMSWDEFVRWAQPYQSPQYVEGFKKFWFGQKSITCAWWGDWVFENKVHGIVRKGEDTYTFDFQKVLEMREEVVEGLRCLV
jgi:DNA repair photolyase